MGWDPAEEYRYVGCKNLLLDISEVDEGTAVSSQGEMCCHWKDWLQISSALLCSMQWGITVSPGEAPHCSLGQLSAHPMQPLLAPHRGKICVQFFPLCLPCPCKCVCSAVSGLREGSARAHGSVSVLRPWYCHSPGLNASRVCCLMQLKCWVVEELLCASLLSAACYVWHLSLFCCYFEAQSHEWL